MSTNISTIISNSSHEDNDNSDKFTVNHDLKCIYDNCPYGPNGSKFFKKKNFLQNHIKNKHEEKKFDCRKCRQKFALEWQLKHHEKYCGQKLSCGSCGKCYDKPLSLWMHCKRSRHLVPDVLDFKLRKSESSNLVNNYIIVPVIIPIESCDHNNLSMFNQMGFSDGNSTNQLILPKTADNIQLDELNHETSASSITSVPGNSYEPTSKILNPKTILNKSKRSTECQTARKRHRRSSRQTQPPMISIETQTLHSSFDSMGHCDPKPDSNQKSQSKPINEVSNNTEFANASTTKSSCTQTFFDFDEDILNHGKDPFLIKSTIGDDDDDDDDDNQTSTENHLNQSGVTHYQRHIETQTNWDPIDNELQFCDFPEFVDIETQTTWNYDRTTQTDTLYFEDENDQAWNLNF